MKKSKTPKIILAVETSCDETAAAILTITNGKSHPQISTLSSVVKSQIQLHSKMGGVVPEVAARAHIKNILPVIKKSLTDSKLKLNEIDYFAVTAGPGLIPSLIVGVEFMRALSLATGKPLIPVNHMLGHLYSPMLKVQNEQLKIEGIFPQIALIVSGGHTMLVLMKSISTYKVLGQTVDDAAGEAFDKVAKLLKLPYPGGPEVSKLAMKASQSANGRITFPRPMINAKNYNFSFSGLKTAVLYHVQLLKTKTLSTQTKANICKAFQDAAVDVLVSKTLRAVNEYGAKSISLSGGVAANASLREKLKIECEKLKVRFFVPPQNLCTDNAEMIGIASAYMLHNGFQPKNYKTIQANSNLEL